MRQEGACRRRAVVGRAFEYVREQAWLARGLERHFADTLTSDRWTAWTLAEPSVPDVRLEWFSHGGALCRGDGVRRGLVRELLAVMTRDGPTACVVPDPMARPGDRGLRRGQTPYIVVDDGVYYVERERDPDRLRIAWAWAGSASGMMGFVTTAPPDSAAPTHEHLRAAAARATLIVFEAYDGEGALFFERRPVP
jgi:hypothetical protein